MTNGVNTKPPRDSFFCRIRGMYPGPEGQEGPSYCMPNTAEAAERFREFKRQVNAAAIVMGLTFSVDVTNPNIDEDTYRLVIYVARRLVDLLTREGRSVSELANSLAAANPDDFLLMATDYRQIEPLILAISQGQFGNWVPPPPAPVYRLRRGGLAVIVGTALLAASAALLIPHEWTYHGLRPSEV